jgi:hypothetical protein
VTTERRCPQCQGEGGSIKPANIVTAEAGLIKVAYHCAACGELFMFVREARPFGGLTV